MAAATDPVEPDRVVIEQAALWHAQLADEDCEEHDRVLFEVWLNAAPAHRLAFERMTALAGRVSRQAAGGRKRLETLSRRRTRQGGVAALLLLGAIGLTGWSMRDSPLIRSRFAAERTSIGELRSTQLSTHDRLTLDTDSAADFGKDRVIRLWRGGVMAKVQPSLPAPFIVRTDQGSARALGTRFSVRIEGQATIVSVMESHVEACARSSINNCVVLAPGQAARLDATGAHRLADIDPAIASAWAEGLLIADDRPLASVLAELNRYRQTPIGYSTAEIAGLNLTGALPLTDTDRALASIEAALPVRVEQTDGVTIVRRR